MQWHTPIGYKVLDGKIVVYEEHRRLVEQIFRDYDSGISAFRRLRTGIQKSHMVENGKKKIVWRCSNRLTNGRKHCKKSETLEEGSLNKAVMEVINRITRGNGDFVGAFRQNVIRVIGSYSEEQEPYEFDERYRRIAEKITTLKEEQIEARRKKKLADSYEQRLKDMDSYLGKQTCQIPEFDNDLVRRLIASIKVVSAEKLIIQFQSGIVMEQEIRYE